MSRIVILILVCLEIVSQCYYVHHKSETASILYLILGIVIGAYLIMAPPKDSIKADQRFPIKWTYLLMTLLFLFMGSYSKGLFEQIPIDYRTADMLPIIKIMCQRILSGNNAYEVIPEIWGGMQPIYMPALWMAYIPAEIIQMDMRWIGIAALLLSFCMVYSSWHKGISAIQLLSTTPVALLVIALISVDSSLITMTEEPIVICYYTLMGWSMIHKHWKVFGAAAALCLLSRYSLAPWLIVFGILLLIRDRHILYKVVPIGSITLICLLLASGAWQYIEVFMSLESSYLDDIQKNQGKYQEMIRSGLGVAKFYQYDRLSNLHITMKSLAIISPIVLGLAYLIKKKDMDIALFGLASLKVCLVLFYNLIIMPYSYLFYTSTFISLLILSCYYFSHAYVPSTKKGHPLTKVT